MTIKQQIGGFKKKIKNKWLFSTSIFYLHNSNVFDWLFERDVPIGSIVPKKLTGRIALEPVIRKKR